MSRATIIVRSPADRIRAARWAERVPENTVIEFREQKRSLEQNAALWAALTDIARQKELGAFGKRPAEDWKAVMMQACGHEVRVLPTLDGKGFFPVGHKSSQLTQSEMSALLDFIMAWGAENGVTFSAPAYREEQAA